MAFSGFPQGAQAFLADLATHNDRDWFAENRERYERDLLGPEKEFVAEMASRFPAFDGRVQAVPAVDASIFRIYRDVRFSRDKSPYKNHADLWFWVGSDRKVAVGYFLRLIPGAVWIGGGIHTLTPEQLERYRNAVVSADAGSRLIEAVDAVRAAGLRSTASSASGSQAASRPRASVPSSSSTCGCTPWSGSRRRRPSWHGPSSPTGVSRASGARGRWSTGSWRPSAETPRGVMKE